MSLEFDELRFVVFLTAKPSADAVDMWAKAFGKVRPDQFQQTPNGGSTAGGRQGEVLVSIQVQPNRFDVVIERLVDHISGKFAPANYEQAVKLGLETAAKLSEGEAVQRPAVVFQASESTTSMVESVNKVAAHVPARYPSDAIDLFYQVVVPTVSEVDPAIVIHRLARWNTGRRLAMQVEITSGQAIPSQVGGFVASTYVDVFAVSKVSEAKLNDHFRELVKEATEILSKGYDHFG